jgi:Uma2 family endonuclease
MKETYKLHELRVRPRERHDGAARPAGWCRPVGVESAPTDCEWRSPERRSRLLPSMGMARRLKIGATYDDLVAVPENLVAEMFDGELYASPRPALPHAHAASVLGMEVGGPFQRGRNGPGGWWLLHEPELHFGRDVLVPDLAGWRRERLPAVPRRAYLTLAPDWVCEVLSSSTEAIDRGKKLHIYARERVAHAWLVNPVVQTLEVLSLASERWTLVATYEGDVPVRAQPFDAVEIELGALWT